MSCCNHCNWQDTDKCELFYINEELENGEISEDEASDRSFLAIMKCEDGYYDYQIDQGDVRNDK